MIGIMNIKTIEEVRERHDRLVINLDLIFNKKGKENVEEWIKTLKYFLDNPQTNLRDKIKNTSLGTKRQTFRWIAGEVG